MSDLKDRLNKTKEAWNYLWNVLEKEVKREDLHTEVLMQLYKYQVELESARHLLELYESKLNKIEFSNEDKETVSEGLARYISTFQAIALSIENLLNH